MAFKIILAQPAIPRFFWEVETLLTNLKEVASDANVVVLFDINDQGGVDRISEKYDVEVHSYNLPVGYDHSYPPAVQFYLLYRYLAEDQAREQDTYLQVDSDIIFRKFPSLPTLKGKQAIGADCGGYIDYNYLITRKNGQEVVNAIASAIEVKESVMKKTPGIGAQYCISKPTAQLYQDIWEKSYAVHYALQPIDSDVQKWTAGMWSQLYVLAKNGYAPIIEPELNHCTPTDNIDMWDQRNILHNAGVVGEGAHGLFYKGGYTHQSPFNEDLSWVRRDKAGWHYARAIEKAAQSL